MPRRIQHNIHLDAAYRGQSSQAALNVGFQNAAHAAAGGGHGHFDVELVAIFKVSDAAIVDQPKVHYIHGNLRIVDGPEHVPHQLFAELLRLGFGRGGGWLHAERVGIISFNAQDVTGVIHHGEAAAQRLREPYRTAGAQKIRTAAGDRGGLAIAGKNDFLIGIHSVETASCLPSSAACSACHAREAHFTRTGNSDTPANTASLPSSSGTPFLPVTSA